MKKGIDSILRIPELDGIRGLAILLVLVWHYFANLFRVDGYMWILHATKLTWAGVDLFFVLSGFLITRILIDAKTSENYFVPFYVRRAFRILPLYWLLLILYIIFSDKTNVDFSSISSYLFTYFAFLQNFEMAYGFLGGHLPNPIPGPHWLGVTWSLAIEEQFYLIIPFAVRYLKPKTILSIGILGIIVAIYSRANIHIEAAKVMPFSRGECIIYGVMVAILYSTKELNSILRMVKILTSWIFLPWLIATLYLSVDYSYQGQVWIHTFLGVLFAMVLMLTIDGKFRFNTVFRISILRYLGVRCYGLYLLHMPVLGILFWLTSGSDPILETWTDFVIVSLSLIMTIVLSEISFRWIESPLIKMGHRVNYK